ncbi:MAG: hypothetical protein HC877_24105 [Thioploca sp.]|nr:hypothetical protein [Thioploca sp.]
MSEFIQKVPMFKGASLDFWNPTHINYFINRIKNKESFSIIRFNLDAWTLFITAFNNMGFKSWPKNNINNNFLKKLGVSTAKALEVRNKTNGMNYIITAENFEGILKMIVNPKPKNFHLSVSDRTYYYGSYPIPNGKPWVANLIKQMCPPGEIPFNSLVWKTWAMNGQIHKLFTDLKEYEIVLIGPHYLSKLPNIVKNNKIKHIKIHETNASINIEKQIKKLISLHEKLQNGDKKIIYICEGGAPVNWLIYRLHGKLKNAYMLDVGRSLDIYFYNDPIRKKTPHWQWGGWVEPNPPTWMNKI